MIEIRLPVGKDDVRGLKIGDAVSIYGVMLTARDAAHKFLVEERPEELRDILNGTFLYHCGPIVRRTGGDWEFVAAGPTTSIREEPYEPWVIEHYGLRGIIGKGGMGPGTLEACSHHGCVYLSAVGGAASLLAGSIKKVLNVYKLDEFGVPEAMWLIEAEGFPAIVTMDSHGGSLHTEVETASAKRAEELIGLAGGPA
jgi:fumarate hydratase class I